MVFTVPAQPATLGVGKYASGSLSGAIPVTGLGLKKQRKQPLPPTMPICLAVIQPRKPDTALELFESTITAQAGTLMLPIKMLRAPLIEGSNAKMQSPAALYATALAETVSVLPTPTILKKNVGSGRLTIAST